MANRRIRKMGRRKLHKRANAPPPDPIQVPISQEFVGNDGPWSTFSLRLGTPPQFMKVLASTSSPETWVVDSKGCSNSDPKDCQSDRGQIFDSAISTTWTDWTNGTEFPLDRDRGLPMEGQARYGMDVWQLNGRHGDPGQAVTNHIIAQISTKDYFLGMIGLSPRQLSPEKRREGHVSNIVDMKTKGLIPSLSYGYTAGARYRRQGPNARMAHASLVIGGYDKSAFKPNGVDFKMGEIETGKDLTVSVRSISFGNNETTSTNLKPLSTTPFSAVIDSAVSHYWLPKEVCDTFAKAFDLRYNDTMGLYLLNEGQHEKLTAENPTITIKIADEMNPGSEVTISYPYSSFELRATNEYPHNPKWGRYFPIQPASNPSQFTLGRAFLQEAYLVANYEQKNFSIAQRAFDAGRPMITPIRDPTKPIADEKTSAATYGLIAGGCALAGLLILFLTYRCARKRSKDMESQDSTLGKTELDSNTQTIYELDKGAELIEMDGKPSRVEAVNPDLKCAFDAQEEVAATIGPFEMPANETPERSDSKSSAGPSSSSSPPPASPVDDRTEDELISPVEGTLTSSGFNNGTWDHTVSPITPSESSMFMRREPSVPTLPTIQEKGKEPEKPTESEKKDEKR